MQTEFTGIKSQIIKLVLSWLTPERVLLAAQWAVKYAIEKEPDIEKRKTIVFMAVDILTKSLRFCESLEPYERR